MKNLGIFYVTGQIVLSNSGRSFKVFVICEDKTQIFIGLIPKLELYKLLKKEISVVDICKFSDRPNSAKVAQEMLDHPNQPSKGAISYFRWTTRKNNKVFLC